MDGTIWEIIQKIDQISKEHKARNCRLWRKLSDEQKNEIVSQAIEQLKQHPRAKRCVISAYDTKNNFRWGVYSFTINHHYYVDYKRIRGKYACFVGIPTNQ